ERGASIGDWRRLSLGGPQSRNSGLNLSEGNTKRSRNDFDHGTVSDSVVELNDVARTHADAAVAGGAAHLSLLRRPVNVDRPIVGAPVLSLESTQTEDPSNDRIAAWRVNGHNLARRLAILELHSDRRTPSDLLCDFHAS